MKDIIHQFRQQISLCWDDETISPKFLPATPDQIASAGQCTATSYVLTRFLNKTYDNQAFTMMAGEVWHHGKLTIPYHVWVLQQNTSNPRKSIIIDVTADQSRVLPETIVESAQKLAKAGTQYIAYTPIYDLRLIGPAATQRAKLLEKKYRQIVLA